MKFFLPKQVAFFDLLEQLKEHLKEEVTLFVEFVHEFKDFDKYDKRSEEIEHKADEKTHEIIQVLNKTFITPIDREDIYRLAHELDDIIDLINSIVHSINIYKFSEKFDGLDEFAHVIKEADKEFENLLRCLRGPKHRANLTSSKTKIHTLEDEGDKIFAKSITHLFNNGTDPIQVIKQKDILESLERTIDKFQAVGDVIEGIIVKSS